MDPIKECAYCGAEYEKDTEHVFPFGLGGQDIFIHCVCADCNTQFSRLEQELYQKSYIALMRSTEGVEGYRPSKDKPAPFKAATLVTTDSSHKIVYEVGQYHQMKIFIRPQLIELGGSYYIEGDTSEGVNDLSKIFLEWSKSNLTLVAKNEISGELILTEFILKDRQYITTIGNNAKLKKAIKFFTLPKTHEFYPILSPRIFIDDDKILKVRAKSEVESIKFLQDLLTYNLEPRRFSSYPAALEHPLVRVNMQFNQRKVEQALVKIGLNCLLYYYPGSSMAFELRDLINYVRQGSPNINAWTESKDSIKDNNEGTHNLFFYQLESAFVVRISLFNGHFVFSFSIDKLKLLKKGEYNRLLIDYKKRRNTFQNHNAFLESFVPPRHSENNLTN